MMATKPMIGTIFMFWSDEHDFLAKKKMK